MQFFTKNRLVGSILFGLSLQGFCWADAVGKVVALTGNPFALRTLKTVPLKVGDELQAKDSLKTGASDSVTVQLNSGHRFFVLPSTLMHIRTALPKNTELEQETGSLWFKVKPLRKEENFSVRTPTAVAGVRGTAFITMVIDPVTTDLCVCEGMVDLTSGNQTVTVPQGRGSVSKLGQVPTLIFDNRSFVFQSRNLSRKPACMECHWSGRGDTSRLDENKNIIFTPKSKE